MTLLSDLPVEHPLRNASLLSIGAQHRWIGSPAGKGWRPVMPSWRIAPRCFNDLGSAWTDNSQWRATVAVTT